MKIGVITFCQTKDNYGQILQCYALQKYLQKLGHHPFLIQYQQPLPPKAHFKVNKLLKYIRNLNMYVKWFFNNKRLLAQKKAYNKSVKNIDRKFSLFLKENIKLTSVYSRKQLLENPPKADAYICGSDQIWKNDDIFYLSFVPKSALRLAYAPSFGGEKSFDSDTENMIKHELSFFSFLGIREEEGVNLCHRLGFTDAIRVVDPTLLLSVEDYKHIRVDVDNSSYIFVYLLGNSTDCSIDDIQQYARNVGKKVVYVCSQGKYDAYEKTYATIGEWLGYISNADLVITNSFHCVAFSLLYKKQFVSLPLTKGFEKMNGRLTELLKSVGMVDRIWNHNLSDICKQIVDFKAFDEYIRMEREKSKEYLKKVLVV